jgi:hypothetical protein
VSWDGWVSEYTMKSVENLGSENMFICICGLIALARGWYVAKRIGAIVPIVGRNIACLHPDGVNYYSMLVLCYMCLKCCS